MATCGHCGKDMLEVSACKEGVDKSVIPEIPGFNPRNCGDCGVEPGATHHPGCDMERCGICGGQAISCGCGEDPTTDALYWENRADNRWTGFSAGYPECFALGWFCRDLHLDGTLPSPERPMKIGGGNMRWHDPCGPEDEGAHPDLNRWHAAGRPTGEALQELLARRKERE